MSVDRDHGYTFPARYEILDRATHMPGHDWFISEVMAAFSSVRSVISLGTSVGINEDLFAANHPDVNICLVDIDLRALEIAKNGKWNFNDIRPSGLAIDSSDETIESILRQYYLDTNQYSIEERKLPERSAVRLTTRDNVSYLNTDNNNLPLSDSSFDLVISYCSIAIRDKSTIKELARILAPGGLYWNELGLFQLVAEKQLFTRELNQANTKGKDTNNYDSIVDYLNRSLAAK